MVLRLDDATLATLIRALRDVPPEKREYYLRKVAAKVDPSRQLRRYYRDKYGLMSLRIEIDPDSVATCLREVGLPLWDLEKATLQDAIQRFFEAWGLGVFRLVPGDGE
jgi:hypothetical protein